MLCVVKPFCAVKMSLSNTVPVSVTGAVSTVGVIGGAYFAFRLYQENRNKLPEKWIKLGHIKRLYIYPIKSCAPVILNQVECTILGAKSGWLLDRSLMVVDAKDNNFITARTCPELVKIQPSSQRAILTLQHINMESIQVNLAEVMLTQKPTQATVWGAPVPVYDCGSEVGKWLTKVLNQPNLKVRLVYYASQKPRPLFGISKVFKKVRKTDTGAFPDQLSYNIINEATLEDLNSRLKDLKVDERNFRPNMVLSGAQAYDEDNWKYIKIGENIFEVVKPCSRCILTIIDPETGVPDKNKEPLQTLQSYRLTEDPEIRKATGMHPRMGLQLALRSGPGGVLTLNEPFYVAY